MTTLFERIKADQTAARLAKPRDQARVDALTSLVSEAAMVGKNARPPRETTDAEVLEQVRKARKNLADTLSVAPEGSPAAIKAQAEDAVLLAYLPAQMTEDEIRAVIIGLMDANAALKLGDVLKHFKATHPNLYEGATVQRIAKHLL